VVFLPTTLDLINFEKLAAVLFIISGFWALGSSFKAEQSELEKQQTTVMSSVANNSTVEANQLALESTLAGTIAYIIYLTVAIFRKEQIEQEIQSGTTDTSLTPNILLILGFVLALLGSFIRIPAIKQRLDESQIAVVL
jgi:hypothetical protein